ncbi:hypothetical protein [Adlercreutzia sp. ZJ138]|nr:hypothetical protein [Adlercreutzia sp. ZJ138]
MRIRHFENAWGVNEKGKEGEGKKGKVKGKEGEGKKGKVKGKGDDPEEEK